MTRERVFVRSDAGPVDGGDSRRAMDRLFGSYLLVSGVALAFPSRPPIWPVLALLHLLGAALTLGVPPFARLEAALARRTPAVARIIHDWYPLAIMPPLYTELATLNLAVHGGHFFDGVILGIEQAIFGGQPSYFLSRRLPYLPLSEVLHASYLSYYVIIYGPPLLLYALGRRGDFRRLVFQLMLTFFVCYLFFVYFPVMGPRYLFPAPDGVLAQGPVYRLAHRLLQAGSSRGAAFPSSHVAVTTAQTILVFRFLPRLGPIVALLALGLAFGAVYGGFHYATDAIAGFLLAVLIAFLAPAVRRALAGRSERA